MLQTESNPRHRKFDFIKIAQEQFPDHPARVYLIQGNTIDTVEVDQANPEAELEHAYVGDIDWTYPNIISYF